MRGLVRTGLMVALLLGQWLVATGAQAAITISPSPSTGSYTVTWSAPPSATFRTRLYEKVGSGSWSVVGTYVSTVTSKSFSNKAAGTYSYKTDRCFSAFGNMICRASESAVSVTVSAAPPPPSRATAPDAPAKPTVTAGDEELEVEWTAPANNGSAITRYSMHYKASAARSWTTHSLATAGTGTSTTITGLTNGTTYLLQVRAHNAAGISAFSATARGTPRGKPAAPAKPALTAGNKQLSVSWRAPAANGAAITDYDVRYRRSSVTSWSSHSFSGTDTDTTITGLTNGAEYEVQVRAQNVAGESAWSKSATATPVLTGLTMSVSPKTSTDGSYTVSWTLARCFTAWRAQVCRTLQERAGSSGSWSAVSGVGTRATSHDFSGKPDGTYSYRLVFGTGSTAVVVGGPVSVTVEEEEEEIDPPDTPAAPTVTTGTGQLAVTWTAPDDNGSALTDYDVRYKRSSASSWSSHSFSGTGTSTTLARLTNGAGYAVQVRAQNDGGESAWSKSGTGTPLAAPAAPTGPAGSTGTHTLKWVAVTGATGYQWRARKGTAAWSTPAALTEASNEFEDVAAGTWTYQVRACNAGGCGDWSANKTVVVTTGLMTVSPKSSTDGSYTVSWTLTRCFNIPLGGSQLCMTLEERVGEDEDAAWSEVSGIGNSATSHAFSNKADGTWSYRLILGTGTKAAVIGGPVTVKVATSPPAAPGAPTLDEGDEKLTVTWAAPDDNGSALTGYEVRHKRNLDTVTEWATQTAAADATGATVSSLTNGLEYAVQVRAGNAAGWSAWSEGAAGTPRGKPAAPAAPTVRVGDKQLTVSWVAPDDNGAAITDYDVQYKRKSASTWTAHSFSGTGTSTTITGLRNGVAYVVQVRARNAAGWSAWSPDGIPPEPPATPGAPTLGAGDEQLTVSWVAPDDNGSAITDYDVRYKQTSATTWEDHAFSGTGTSTTIDSLTNDVAYEVQVLARNAGGPSAWSDSGTGTPTSGEVAPPVPTGLSGPAAGAVTDPYTISWEAADGATYYELRERRDAGEWTVYSMGTATSKAFTGQASGSWDYQVRACNTAGCSVWSAILTVTVPGSGSKRVPGAPGPTPTAPGTVLSADELTSLDKVGTLPGEFRVAESGAATYSIPLALPPGTAGVAPPLGLHYSSQRGNGLLGVGWTLDGLSAITRCRQTHGQDRNPAALTFKAGDRFCLDGQRLLATKGAYGAPGSEYRTEIDQFLTVTARGGSAGHPDYFEVARKDGSTSFYGGAGSVDSEHRMRLPGTPSDTLTDKALTWALREFKDSAGNKIEYDYTDDGAGHRIREVRYAYGGGNTAQAAVKFTYADRDDKTVGYLAGHRLRSSKRLTQVTVRASRQVLRTYKLSYAAATAANPLSRLTGVQECAGGTGGACLPKTTFAWSQPTALFKPAAATLTLNSEGSWAPVDFSPADINGDGRTDLVWTEAKRGRHRIQYALANKTTGQLGKATFTVGGDKLKYDDDYGRSDYGDNLRVHTEVADVNADGRHDLLVYSTEANETRLHLAVPQADGSWKLDGRGTRLFRARYRYADLDSDGLLDAYKLVENRPAPPKPGETPRWAPTSYDLEVRYLRRDRAAKVTSNRYYNYADAVRLPIDFVPQASNATNIRQWRSLAGADVQLADVDGDGRADLVAWGYDSEWLISLQGGYTLPRLRRLEVFRQETAEVVTDSGTSTVTRFARYGDAVTVAASTQGRIPKGVRVADLNQDGLSDLVYFVGQWYKKSKRNYQWTGDWHYRLSTGAGFAAAVTLVDTAANAQAPSALSLHDDNGDGYADLLWHDVPARKLKLKRWLPKTGAFDSATPTTVRATAGKDEEQYFTLDMNGDGNGDLLHVSGSGSTETLKTYLHKTSGRPHLVTGITNGLKAVTDIRYESLGTTDAYTRVDKLRTTSTTERRCFSWHGSGRFCWPVKTAELNASDFYRDLNDPWPGVSHPVTGGMVAPVLELMGPLYVVTRVDSSAPTAGDAAAKSGIGYAYSQGKVQAAGRGLLGFESLTTVDLQTGVRTTTTYRQDYPYIGLPRKTEVRTRDGKRLRRADNTWQLVGYKADNPRTADVDESLEAIAASSGTAKLGPLQPYLAKAVEQVYALPVTDDKGTPSTADDTVSEGALLSTVTTDTVQDTYGNPTAITTTTVDHANKKRFRQVTANTYGTDAQAKRYGRLSATTVTRARDKAKGNGYETETTASRASSFTYYTSGTTKGLLKTEEREPADAALKHRTTYRYDGFGNRAGAMVQAAAGATATPRETRCNAGSEAVQTHTYDNFGRYVQTEKDCLGRTRRTLKYNAHGLPLTAAVRLDKTNTKALLTTAHTYTAGGRLVFTRDGTGAYTATLRASCAMNADCPTGAAFYDETRQPGNGTAQKYRTSRVYRDVLGRAVRNSVIGFNDGKWVHTDTEYDALGRVKRRSEPYYDKATSYWTAFEYDLLGRVVKTVLPDDTSTLNSEITVTYAGLTTTTTNAKGQKQVETRNALDEVIKTRDHAGTTVSHTYDAWGQVIKTVVAGTGVSAVTTTMKYDARGRRTALTDPDRGTIKYEYNGFDELVQQTDARDHYQAMTYDGLGRIKTRKDYAPDGPDAGTAPDLVGEAAWTWDGTGATDDPGNSLGQWVEVKDTKSGYTRTRTYDSLGRPSVTAVIPGTGADTYYEKQTWDGYGRPYQHFDAARTGKTWDDNVTETQYNQYGYAYKWVDGVYENDKPGATYREITGQDARGNVTGEKLGGGALRTARTFDAKTGRIGTIRSTAGMVTERQELGYTWDELGNLTRRTDTTGTRNLTESFTYDTLNRLTSSRVGTGTAQTVSYDALGNIKSKTGVGRYSYGAGNAGPHAVTTAGSDTYTYDAAGNQLTGAGRTLTYTAFNKVGSIVKGNHTMTFAYGPERARFKRTDTDNKGTAVTTDDKTSTTLYIGSVEKVTYSGSLYEYKRYIAGGVALITEKHETTVKDGTPVMTETVTTQYLLRDHLGSISVITDALGAMVQELSYDSWGQRRHAATWGDLTALARMGFDTSRTYRGYTGHEMLDAVGIIHMNGRIYDPKLGRFMQADPVIQFPDFSQSHNRYSYVLNNPLAYTDPSGYFIGKLFKKVFKGLNKALGDFAPFLSIALLAVPGINAWAFATWQNAFAFGFVTGGIATGSLRGGLFGGISAAAFVAIGSQFTAEAGFFQAGGAGHVLTHGVTGGILAELQGGQFGHGFLAAGLTKAVMGRFSYHDGSAPAVLSRTAIAATVGGTISRITGGKFANGALTSAMAQLFNAEASAARARGAQGSGSFWDNVKRFGQRVWKGLTSWHYEGRDALNTNLPNIESARATGSLWRERPANQNLFHDDGIGNPESTFVHPDGREVVFDGDTFQMVTDGRYRGTYNYINPAPFPDSITDVTGIGAYIGQGTGHLFIDVLPYAIGGNVRGPN